MSVVSLLLENAMKRRASVCQLGLIGLIGLAGCSGDAPVVESPTAAVMEKGAENAAVTFVSMKVPNMV